MKISDSFRFLIRILPVTDPARVKPKFNKMAQQDRNKAVRYLNRSTLRFPYLFILIPEIEAMDLGSGLNARNIDAIVTCAKKLDREDLVKLEKKRPPDGGDQHAALKWMFETGVRWEGPENENRGAYEAALDAAAALLIGDFEDHAVLPAVADLIFKRNRKGRFTHDLAWSFFQDLDPDSLRRIAGYLLSDDEGDVKLACMLLHLQPPKEHDGRAARRRLHKEYLAWLDENAPYLYLTGEHFQLTSSPNPLDVDLGAKYLCKKISPRTAQPLEPFDENERRLLENFHSVPESDRKRLAEYSVKIHGRDIRSWKRWMQMRLRDQIGTAKAQEESR